MSRAHISGFDSNPAQFERMGNPWVGPRDRQELGNFPVSKGQQRRNRKPRPCDLPYPEIRRIARELTPEEAKAKQQREMLNHVLRLGKVRRSADVRECHNYPPAPKPVRLIKPMREEELDPWNPARIAGDLERLAKQAEQAKADVQAKKLDQMQAALAKFGKRMARATD